MSSSSSSSSGGAARGTGASRIAQPSALRRPATAAASAAGPSKLTIPGGPAPRAPLNNATNRSTSATSAIKKPSALPATRRVPSGSSSTTARTASLTAGTKRQAQGPPSTSSEEASPSQLANIESQLAQMAALFDRERANTEAQMASEQQERKKYEDRVTQLEESLEEQKRMAKESKREVGRRRTLFDDEMAQLRQSHAREKRNWEEDLERERNTIRALKDSMAQNSTAHLTMEATNSALRTEVQKLQDELRSARQRTAEVEAELVKQRQAVVEIEGELREAESLRRKLHNEVQELRGNIRVFARMRPALGHQGNSLATIRFPNPKEGRSIEILSAGESATGTATMRTFQFDFDRVFGPEATQLDVFDEVQHLMQSVLDGYNTCIFAYGQTGSGKTHTLEGSGLPTANYDDSNGSSSSSSSEATATVSEGAGLIPRAVQMLFATAEALKDKGWTYHFEGSMLEIYNETINDLLGKAKLSDGEHSGATKHEIKHEKGRTTVSDAVVLPLSSPSQVFALLGRASSRRSVAATLMNERSSRSHSVFTLRVRGSNATTLESCDATLSLVDLAGSERLANSGSGEDPRRLKEAVSINKSLSSLADVIAALGQGKAAGHVPYRNSTLTWLLKNSLGGNSKTLMLASLSPMAEHLGETVASLRFAKLVNGTIIGTAKKVKAGGESA